MEDPSTAGQLTDAFVVLELAGADADVNDLFRCCAADCLAEVSTVESGQAADAGRATVFSGLLGDVDDVGVEKEGRHGTVAVDSSNLPPWPTMVNRQKKWPLKGARVKRIKRNNVALCPCFR